MKFFEKTISNLIEKQFPSFYEEEGPVFIEFAKAYYEWLETPNNAVHEARSLLELRDIDSTVDDFLIHFKSKYLNNLQYDVAVNSRSLIKHSLDLYRSKGTERSIDLFFKSVFGVPASVYYPAQDIFKASAGEWYVPTYLEIAPFDGAEDFVNAQIIGATSGATAFVEKFIKKRTNGSAFYTYVYFISNLVGDFITGEKIIKTSTGELGPTVIGSMTALIVVDGAQDYSIGDEVTIVSSFNGRNGKARVTDIQTISGKTTFSLIDGGWGYGPNSEILISDKILTITNIEANDSTFTQFETVAQYSANLTYDTLDGESFSAGDIVYRVDSIDGSITAQATVISSNVTNSSYGVLQVVSIDGNFDGTMEGLLEDGSMILFENALPLEFDGVSTSTDGFIYKFAEMLSEDGDTFLDEDGNIILSPTVVTAANVLSYSDTSTTANVMKIASNTTIALANVTTRFAIGEIAEVVIDGITVSNGTVSTASYSGTNGTILLTSTYGSFHDDDVLSSANSDASGIVTNVTKRIGIIDTVGDFIASSNSPIIGLSSGTVGTIQNKSSGTDASFDIVNAYSYSEDVVIYTSPTIASFLTVALDDTYEFSSGITANLLSIINDSFTTKEGTYGQITEIVNRNSGINYDAAPYVVIYDHDIASLSKRDYVLTVSNTVASFVAGEDLLMAGETLGFINTINGNELYIKRKSLEDPDIEDVISLENGNDVLFEDDTTMISEAGLARLIGATSGASAMADSFIEDPLSTVVGLNAIVQANTTSAGGSVTELEVIDSGFNYYNSETVTFVSPMTSIIGTAKVVETKQGKGSGYHKRNDSVLSGNKYLQDGNYYQQFSYEIQSSISMSEYADMLKNVLHVAGTKAFARFVNQSDLELGFDVGIEQVIVE